MKKIFKIVGTFSILCFSFFYTDKVVTVISDNDPLKQEIINVSENYKILPNEAVVKNDEIIPGSNGRVVNVEKTYKKMRRDNIFNNNYVIYDSIYPKYRLIDNKDKYIIRGNKKNEVSLLLIYSSRDYDKIKNIDNITVYINHKDINTSTIKKLKDKEIYPYGNNGEYTKEILDNDNTLINRLSNNKSKYCLLKEKNNEYLDLCTKNNMMVVIPSEIGGYTNIKKSLTSGSIILLEDISNIDIIIKYINSKGYSIVPLSKLLIE